MRVRAESCNPAVAVTFNCLIIYNVVKAPPHPPPRSLFVPSTPLKWRAFECIPLHRVYYVIRERERNERQSARPEHET